MVPGIDQLFDPLAGGEAVLLVLPLDGRLAAAEADIGFLLGELGDEFGQRWLGEVGHRASGVRDQESEGFHCRRLKNDVCKNFCAELDHLAQEKQK